MTAVDWDILLVRRKKKQIKIVVARPAFSISLLRAQWGLSRSEFHFTAARLTYLAAVRWLRYR